MRSLCNLTLYITVEAATLIGLTFVAATSYVVRSVMARKKKSGAPKPPQPPSGTSLAANPAAAPSGADAKSLAQAKPDPVAAPVIQEIDTRPETSPYGSPACTIPFSSPLTLPLDILKKSPKLHAAYESRLPELPSIPEDVGHVLVHYLHTGTYESLRPKATEATSKQISELKTSIQAYAAARAYDLPDLMRLAAAKIDRHGEGLPLPALLEVARDAYPTLTEADGWFLDYLRSRIRPHLKDPKLLLGSNLLDQISSILSPNKILLRTVLELFCERMAVRSDKAPSAITSTTASHPASPESAGPVFSPLPASPMSLLDMRPGVTARDEFPLPRKTLRATPWPSPDNMSEASWARETSTDMASEKAPPEVEAKPMPEPLPVAVPAGPVPLADLGPVILDVVPPPTVPAALQGTAVAEAKGDAASEPEVAAAAEPEASLAAGPELEVPVETGATSPSAPGTNAAADSEKSEKDGASDQTAGVQRERKDSGKDMDLEQLLSKPEPLPELVSELETKSSPKAQAQTPTLREADSGFWESPDVDAGKEPAPSLVELDPVPAAEPAHELDSRVGPEGAAGVDTRDFASPSEGAECDAGKKAEQEPGPARDSAAATPPTQELSSEAAEKDGLRPEPVPTKSTKEAAKLAELAEPAGLPGLPGPDVPEIVEVDALPEKDEAADGRAAPETEKPPKESLEPEAVAKPEPEPEADSPHPVPAADGAQPAGAPEPPAAQPGLEPGAEPAGTAEDARGVCADAAGYPFPGGPAAESPALLGPKPAPEQAGAKTEADAAEAQPCGAQVRQRGWKRRFLSLRYPVLFGRGM